MSGPVFLEKSMHFYKVLFSSGEKQILILGASLEQERWVFEEVLSGETRGPVLRNRGRIR